MERFVSRKTKTTQKGKSSTSKEESAPKAATTPDKAEESSKETAAPEAPVKETPKPKAESKPAPKVEQKKEAPKPAPAPAVKKYKLQDIARRNAIGYKEFWIKSIEQYAKTTGFTEPASEEECKAVIRGWGAKLK